MAEQNTVENIIELYKGKVQIRFVSQRGDDPVHEYWLLQKPKMKRLTGATTIIGVLDKSKALVPWAVDLTVDFLQEHQDLLKKKNVDADEIYAQARAESERQKNLAAELGKAIHGWIEAHIKGERPDMPEDENVLKGVMAFVDWKEKNKVKFLWSERVVYSKKYGYVGTADLGAVIGAGELKGKKLLCDVKTSNGIYSSVRLQTAAYLGAIIEESGEKYDGRLGIRISKETEGEYMTRMQKKVDAGKLKWGIPPFQIFEAVFLDAEDTDFKNDLGAFIAAKDLYDWEKVAGRAMWQRNK